MNFFSAPFFLKKVGTKNGKVRSLVVGRSICMYLLGCVFHDVGVVYKESTSCNQSDPRFKSR